MKKFEDLPVEEHEWLLERFKVGRIAVEHRKPLKIRKVNWGNG